MYLFNFSTLLLSLLLGRMAAQEQLSADYAAQMGAAATKRWVEVRWTGPIPSEMTLCSDGGTEFCVAFYGAYDSEGQFGFLSPVPDDIDAEDIPPAPELALVTVAFLVNEDPVCDGGELKGDQTLSSFLQSTPNFLSVECLDGVSEVRKTRMLNELTVMDAGEESIGPVKKGGKCCCDVILKGEVKKTYQINIDLIDVGIDIPAQWILNAIKPPPSIFKVEGTVPKGYTGELHAEIKLEKAENRLFIPVFGLFQIQWATVTVIGPKEVKGVIKNLQPIHCCVPDPKIRMLYDLGGGLGDACGADGDPHIKSWGEKWFDYMGQCDLRLVFVPMFDNHQDMTVHIRTTIRYEYSYIEAVALKIGHDILEVDSFGVSAFNGVEGATGANNGVPTLGGYPVYHRQVIMKNPVNDVVRSAFDVVIGDDMNVTIRTFKDWVGVHFSGVDEDTFGAVSGLMGSYDGRMLARNGTDLEDNINALGQDWQVQADEETLFRTGRRPQSPEPCLLPEDITPAELSSRHLRRRLNEGSISKDVAEEACAHLNRDARAFCVRDVMASGDLEAALEFEAF